MRAKAALFAGMGEIWKIEYGWGWY